MPIRTKSESIPLFGHRRHSFVPANTPAAAARSGGPGRPNGRRACALPWTGASTVAALLRTGGVGTLLCAVVTTVPCVAANEKVPLEMAAGCHSAENAALRVAIDRASDRFGVSATWIAAIVRVESCGNARAVSPKGARGLMQLMPETWSSLRDQLHLGSDPFDVSDNVMAGTAYLRRLIDRYGVPRAFAAYNAGPSRIEREGKTAGSLPNETAHYLAKLAALLPDIAFGVQPSEQHVQADWRAAGLFPTANPLAFGTASTADLHADRATSTNPPTNNVLFVNVSRSTP